MRVSTAWLLLLGSLLLVVACGVFVAAEFSFVTVDRATVERAAREGDPGAEGVLSALQRLSTQLSGAQLGITVTNLAIGYMAEPAVAALIAGPLESLTGMSPGAARGVSLVVALALATAVTMVYGELVPKNLAIAEPFRTARAVQAPMRGFTRGTAVVIRVFNGTANRILRAIGLEPQEELASARTAQELLSLVRRSAEQGTLEKGTASLLQRSLRFGDKQAIDVRTHRTQMVTTTHEQPVSDVLALSRESGHSRFPVVRGGAGAGEEVVGIVHVKHAVAVPPAQRPHVPVRAVMVPPVLVPETLPLDGLLETLRSGGLQMAVVVDEFGGVDGVVTLEDLVEELVGDVLDEHDQPVPVATGRDGRWTVDGTLRPDEVADLTGLQLPEHSSYETVGGLVVRELGRLAAAGDSVVVPVTVPSGAQEACLLEVVSTEGRRVGTVALELLVPLEAEDLPEPGRSEA